MAATIQNIELPKKPRALDSSTSVQVVSQELIDEGNFSGADDGDPWVVESGWTISSNKAHYAPNTGREIYQTVTTVAGRTYSISYEVSNWVAEKVGVYTTQSSNATTALYEGDEDGSYSRTFIATGSTAVIRFRSSNTSANLSIDNASVKEVENFSNNNHGKIYSGRALEFDGVADYLTAAANPDLILGKTSHTLTAWFKTDRISSDYDYIVAIGNNAEDKMSSIGVQQGKLFASRYSNAELTTNAHVDIGTWYRFTAVITEGETYNTIDFYLNGVFVEQKTSSTAYSVEVGKLSVGVHLANAINFTGAISDVQVWDKAWTAADVAYDYANPESLALNASGTALTEGNLKVWYPMQDGHRGQQSYILDGANTGLGDDIAVNGTFDSDLSGWEVKNATGANQATWVDGKARLLYDNAVSTSALGIRQSLLTAGTQYKVTFDIIVADGTSGVAKFYNYNIETATGLGTGSHAVYFTAEDNNFSIYRNSSDIDTDLTIDNVSVKAINDKHHATTVFYGDELITTAADRTLAGGNTWNVNDVDWSYDASNDELDYNGAGEGHVLLPRLSAQTEFVLITGRTYRLVFENDNTGDDTKITFRDGLQSEFITADTANNLTFDSDNGDWQTSGGGAVAWGADFGASGGGIGYTPPSSNTSPMMGIRLHTDYLPTVEAGVEYLVSASIKGVTGQLDDFRFTLGSAHSEDFTVTTSHATYSHIITAVDDDQLLIVNGNNGTGQWFVDNVSIKKVGVNDLIAEATYTDGTKTVDFVAPADSSGLMITAAGDSGSFSIESFSVKEIGVASGWTDADQQLDIAQPALQSYNELLHSFDSSSAGFNAVTLVKVDDNAAIDIGTGDFSLSLWFKTDATYGNYTALIRKGGWASDGYSMGFTSGNKLAINIANHVGEDHVDNYNDWAYTDTAIELGKWYHVVGVWDRSAGMTLYLNGVAQTMVGDHERDTSGDNLDSASDFNMYSSSAGATGHFAGCINEVALFKDVAFSADKVLELYNKGKALDATLCSQAHNLDGYWRNNGLSAWTDLSTNSNDGAVTGSETILIPQGVDGSRDTQGFIMNRARNTSSFNNTASGGYVEIPVAAVDDDLAFLGVGDGFSIQAWVKVNNEVSNGALILSRNNNTDGYRLEYTQAEKLAFGIEENGNISHAITDSAISTNTWYHVVGTFDGDPSNNGSGEVKLYLNGETDGSVTNNNTSADMGTSISPMRIGKHYWGQAVLFDGEIDGVLIYNKVLSLEEVTRNYKATKGSHRN